jgi:predicted ATPase/DNA-binding winged helix-turn-helix (wHTH) protein
MPVPAPPQDADAFQFGDFVVRPALRALEKSGRTVAIGARAFDILLALIRTPNEIVTVAGLKEAVWRGVHVEDVVVRVHISNLRKILGEGVIKNVAGRGYCLSADVTPLQGRTAQPEVFYRDKLQRPPQFPLRLIGRDETIAQVGSRLAAKRFITVVGPGGVGKTTIALVAGDRLAGDFADTVCFVDLSPLTDPGLVAGTIASALGLPVSSSDARRGLIDFLRDKTLLIILDNCEHLLGEVAAILEAIYANAPGVHLLATSRAPLRAQGEHVVRIAPLKVPADTSGLSVAQIAAYPAVELFLERASAAEGIAELTAETAGDVASICRKLDGLPLAIELAAARCDVYSLAALNAALDDRVRMLWTGRRSAPDRHQTLEALIDWSFTLLDEGDRSVLLAVSVFQGPFRMAAAEAVGGWLSPDLSTFRASFQKLVSSSLVAADLTRAEPRYRLLDATRAFAAAKLEAAGLKLAVKRRHLACLLEAASRAEAAWGEQPPPLWLDSFRPLIDDLRATIDWAFSSADDVRDGIRLVAASSALWFRLSLTNEYRTRLLTALTALDAQDAPMPQERLQLTMALGFVTWHTSGAPATMRGYFGEAAALAETLQDVASQRLALWGLWRAMSIAGDEVEALQIAERQAQLIDPVRDRSEHLTNLRMKALSLHYLGRQREAAAFAREIAESQPGSDGDSSALLLDPRVAFEALISRLYWLRGMPAQAVQMAESCFELARGKQHVLSMCYSLVVGLCPIYFWIGDHARARFYTERMLNITASYGYPHWANFGNHYLRMLAHLDGGAAAPRADAEAHHNPFIDELMVTVSPDFVPRAQVERLLAGSERWCSPELLRVKAMLTDDADASRDLLEQSLALARSQGALGWELRTTTSLARLLAGRGAGAEARARLAEVYGRFTEGFDTRDLRAAKAVLQGL